MLDPNHPGYPAAVHLANSGWPYQPLPKLDVSTLLWSNPELLGQLQQIGWGMPGQTVPTGALAFGLAPYEDARRQALITYGGIPSSVQVDDTIRQAAADATAGGYSTLARLAHQYQLANVASNARQGALGAVGSSAYGAGLRENLYRLNLNRADEQAKLMANLTGIRGNEAQLYQTATGQASSAVQATLKNLTDLFAQGYYQNPVAPPAANYRGLGTPRTNPTTFTAAPHGIAAYGTGTGRIGVLPTGRVPIGGGGPVGTFTAPTPTASKTFRPAAPHSSYGTPGARAPY